ncbi:WXG100 family type VII secretion target [Streptomyces harbinensis]|uniref:PPE domain-containing protein n=1 Tax=Streptomyces harbinensis TaxID=1176198 RepID=A0A1I6RVJ1_9ACTN|nr:WXG100 family type VII secretion target [Streptomyces harbinensis]SFS68702.1 hypothetical protein SAMN05444716_103483 [Streptomyces harbinensis]
MEDPGQRYLPQAYIRDHLDERLETMSHEELAGLLAGANPDALIQRGEALGTVAERVADVGQQIWRAAGELEWQGQAADAFREWISRFYLESDLLGSYASVVGMQITNAGVALRQAQSEMPEPERFRATDTAADPGFQTVLPGVADGTQEARRQEAIAAITRLGSAYKTSAAIIGSHREPQFQNLPVQTSGVDPGSDGTGSVNPPTTYGGVPAPSQAAPVQNIAARDVALSSNVTQPGSSQHSGVISGPVLGVGDGGGGTSLDSVGVKPNGAAPPIPSVSLPPVVERPVVVGGPGGQPPVTGPLPGWPLQAGPGPGRADGGQMPPPRSPLVKPSEVRPPSGSPAGPVGQQPPVGRPSVTGPGQGGGRGSGPGTGNPWGRANNYGLLGGRPVPNAKPTAASRIPPGGVIQPGMSASNSRLVPTKKEDPTVPRGTYGKAVVDGHSGKRGERKRALPKPTGVIGLSGQNRKKKRKKNESKDDKQQP